MKGVLVLVLSVIVLGVSCVTATHEQRYYENASFVHAAERTQTFIDAINNNKSGIVFEMLAKEYRQQCSKETFISRFAEDRTYPYLTPLYLHLVSLALPQRKDGNVVCSVAARLEGEYFRFPIRYEDGDYYFLAFEQLLDGSFREKFSDQVVKWI